MTLLFYGGIEVIFFLYLSNSRLLCLDGLDYLIYENLVVFLLFQVAALIGSILVFC